MTGAMLKQIAQKAGGYGQIIQIAYDDNQTYLIDPKDVLTQDAIWETGDGDSGDLLITHGFVMNKETKMYDIPCTVYRTLLDVRAIICLDKQGDREKVDASNMYSY